MLLPCFSSIVPESESLKWTMDLRTENGGSMGMTSPGSWFPGSSVTDVPLPIHSSERFVGLENHFHICLKAIPDPNQSGKKSWKPALGAFLRTLLLGDDPRVGIGGTCTRVLLKQKILQGCSLCLHFLARKIGVSVASSATGIRSWAGDFLLEDSSVDAWF